MKDFKIRASACGKIMAGSIGASPSQLANIKAMAARTKPMTEPMQEKLAKDIHARDNPQLPQSAKTYCEEWLKQELYGQRIEYSNKYTDKGWAVEEASIKYLDPSYEKNEEYFENDFMCGTPDIITEDSIRDVKNSWDYSTFPLFEDEGQVPNLDYYWQLQVYMILTGRRKGSIDYMLMDTPNDDSLTYTHLGKGLRVKSFAVDKMPVLFDIKARVNLCREYIKTLVTDEHLSSMAVLVEEDEF